MALALSVVAPLLFAAPAPASPPTLITVNTTGDPGPAGTCDLRDAITNANNQDQSGSTACVAGSGTDAIIFSVSGTITLASPLPEITNISPGYLTIDGSGQSITIDGNTKHFIFPVDPEATLKLNDLTIAHAKSGKPGAIQNLGTLDVTNCIFSDNVGGEGGAVLSLGTLSADNCLFENNSADAGGGAVLADGPTTITNCTFSLNHAGADAGGGAILYAGKAGVLTISNSLFVGNTTDGKGGAIESITGNLSIINSTFAGNTSTARGGAIHNQGVMTITNCTLSDNTSDAVGGGVIYNTRKGDGTVSNTILAANVSTDNCDGGDSPPVTDGGYNISDDGTCGFTGTGVNGKPLGDNVADANIALGTLQDNGGFTETFALETGSYAIDAIPKSRCPSTDQRGAPRPDSLLHPACDVGAFESGNLVWITPTSLSFGNVVITHRSIAATVMLNNQSNQNLNISKWSIGPNYTIVSTTCPTPPSILPSDESCTFDIAFRPIYAGVRNETFQVNDNAAGGKQTVTLHGTGVSLPARRTMR